MKDFRTRDFAVAAFLKAKGHPLIRTSWQHNSLLFHFPPSAGTDAHLYFDDSVIPCRSFYTAIKELKALIHGSRELVDSMEDCKYGYSGALTYIQRPAE